LREDGRWALSLRDRPSGSPIASKGGAALTVVGDLTDDIHVEQLIVEAEKRVGYV
jgi:hypothetical protein